MVMDDIIRDEPAKAHENHVLMMFEQRGMEQGATRK